MRRSRPLPGPLAMVILAVGLPLGLALLTLPLDLALRSPTTTTSTSTTIVIAAHPIITDPVAPPATITVTTAPPTSTSSATTRPPAATTTTLPMDVAAEVEIAAAIDVARVNLGLSALWTSPDLQAYAQAQAQRMAETGVLAHGPVETLLNEWVLVGENVGVGGTVEDAVDALLTSPSHYEVIANPAYEADGVGAVRDEEGNLWVCQVFATDELPVVTTTVTVTPPTVETTTTITLPTVPIP